MDDIDVDCASCSYQILDFSHVAPPACGHGLMHYNCSFFNNVCSVCEAKLTVSNDNIQFRPKNRGDDNLQLHLLEINKSLLEIKNLLVDQRQKYNQTTQLVEGLSEGLSELLKSKDEMILQQQKEIYELKLEKVELIKLELQKKLNSLTEK